MLGSGLLGQQTWQTITDKRRIRTKTEKDSRRLKWFVVKFLSELAVLCYRAVCHQTYAYVRTVKRRFFISRHIQSSCLQCQESQVGHFMTIDNSQPRNSLMRSQFGDTPLLPKRQEWTLKFLEQEGILHETHLEVVMYKEKKRNQQLRNSNRLTKPRGRYSTNKRTSMLTADNSVAKIKKLKRPFVKIVPKPTTRCATPSTCPV